MVIDSHVHLEMREFDGDRDAVVQRAIDAGVEAMITIGTNVADCRKAVDIAKRYSAVYAAIGIHPHDAIEISGNTYDILRKLALKPKVVAFGEIGLDFFRNLSPRDIQIRRFGELLDLAVEMDLPVIIHDRDAHDQTIRMLKHWAGKRRGVIHCFSGDTVMAMQCLDMGFYISIAGPVTYPKSDKLAEVIRKVPLDRLLVETDAPYLTPQPHRGKRNESTYVLYTARRIADIKGIPLEEVGKVTTDNVRKLFHIEMVVKGESAS